MASCSSSSSSSQGSVPGVLGKGPQTPGDLIIYTLEDLNVCDFKRFKNKLSDFSSGDKCPIPRGKLENADWIITKDILIDTYGEEGALDATIKVFTLIGLMGPANNLQDRRGENAKLKKTTHDIRLSDFRKEYRDSVKKMFQRINEYNSRMGETVSLQKRYTKLLMRKGRQKKDEKEKELRSTDRRHLQIMEGSSSDKYSPTTIQDLFDPDEDGFVPDNVVLQGPAGIGKTMTSKKIMLDWASGNLYQDKFDFVFYMSCRELNTITGNINLVGLLSRSCRLHCSGDLVSILKDHGSHRKLLFLVDGFDELKWTLGEESEVCHDVFVETQKEIILQSLLRKQILHLSSLIITTRSLAMKKLNTFIDNPRYVEIQGFTTEDSEEYVHKFFGDEEDAEKAISIVRHNDILYTMCAVPITCWIVCTLLKEEIKKDLGLIQCKTMTSIYLLYLEVLITHHSKKDQPVHRKRRVINTCLKKLCALANEGVLNQQILFGEEDLKRHGLSLSEVESVFLNENIFHWDICTKTCYSFIHMSVQEFLAALHYGLYGGFGFMKSLLLPTICRGDSFSALCSDYPHLALAVHFLFGLLNTKEVKKFSKRTGINISLRASFAIKKWAMKDKYWISPTYTILCLYDTQDKDFIRRAMSRYSSLKLEGSHTGNLRIDSNYSKQLGYCLKTLETICFRSIYFESLTLDLEAQNKLSPLIHRCLKVSFIECNMYIKDCAGENEEDDAEESSSTADDPDDLSFLVNLESKIQELRLIECGLTSSCCVALRSIITNTYLTKLHLSNNYLHDSGAKRLFEGLRSPGCTLQELNLDGCRLSPLCCGEFHSVLITNRSLTRLDLSFNNLQDSGIKLLFDGLTHPGCTLQRLSVIYCRATFLCCDDLCSVTTSQTLTRLNISLFDNEEKMSHSEVDRCCEVLRHAGFTVDRDLDRIRFQCEYRRI